MRGPSMVALAMGMLVAVAVPASQAHEHEHEHMDHGAGFAFGAPGEAAKATRTVEIKMLDALKFEPASIEVKAGETVRFVLINTGSFDHDFTIGDAKSQAAHRKEMADMAGMGHDMAAMHDGMGGHANAVFVKAGQSKELVWTFAKPMVLEMGCNIPGHYDAGMKGTITVR